MQRCTRVSQGKAGAACATHWSMSLWVPDRMARYAEDPRADVTHVSSVRVLAADTLLDPARRQQQQFPRSAKFGHTARGMTPVPPPSVGKVLRAQGYLSTIVGSERRNPNLVRQLEQLKH